MLLAEYLFSQAREASKQIKRSKEQFESFADTIPAAKQQEWMEKFPSEKAEVNEKVVTSRYCADASNRTSCQGVHGQILSWV